MKQPQSIIKCLIAACVVVSSFALADIAKKPVARDPQKINPATAVKDTPAPDIDLPGVLKPQGENAKALDFTRTRKILLDGSGIKVIPVNANGINHIVLPFINPRIHHRDTLTVDKRAISNHVYISFNTEDSPAEAEDIFIETPDATGPVLALQLLPKKIPTQTIVVEDVAPRSASAKTGKGNDYVANIQSLTEIAAAGSAPNGYSTIDLNLPPVIKNGLLISPKKKYSSRENDIYVYQATNPTKSKAYLREEEFDDENVIAISIFPVPTLLPGKSSNIVIVTKKAQ
jgi:conjugal transfer pilus assembly protein TraK